MAFPSESTHEPAAPENENPGRTFTAEVKPELLKIDYHMGNR